MADDAEFQVRIKTVYDGSGATQASKSIDGVGASAKKAEGELSVLEGGAAGLKAALIELVAIAEVLSFFKESAEAALDMEKAFRLVDQTSERLGLNVAETHKKVEEFAGELSKLAGVADDEVVKAVGKSFAVTNDLGQAMARASIAADLNTRYDIGMAAAANLVEEAARGKTRSLDKLTHTTTEGTTAAEKATNAMAYLEKNVKGATAATSDHAMQVARLKATWDNFKDETGAKVLKFLDWLQDGFFDVGNGIVLVITKMTNWATATVDIISALGTAVKDAASGHFKEADGYFAKVKAIATSVRDQNAKAEDIAEDADRQRTIEKKARLDAIAVAALAANKKVVDDDVKTTAALTRDMTYQEAAQVQVNALKLKSEQDFEKNKAALKKVGQKFDEATEKDITKTREEEMKKRSEFILKEAKLAIAVEKARQKNLNDSMAASVNTLGEFFGIQKELAIAQAVINTYEGATAALAMIPFGPWNYVNAALVIAAGLADVAMIAGQSSPSGSFTGIDTSNKDAYGSGFDDPRNDAMAVAGGRRWAADMVGKFSSGASQGWAQGMSGIGGGSHITNDNRRTFNVSWSGGGAPDPSSLNSMKQFHRALMRIDSQYEGQRTIARRR